MIESTSNWPSEFRFTFDQVDISDLNHKDMPHRLLVVGDFGSKIENSGFLVNELTAGNIDGIIKSYGLSISIEIDIDEDKHYKFSNFVKEPIDIDISSIACFEPQSILANQDGLDGISKVIKYLRKIEKLDQIEVSNFITENSIIQESVNEIFGSISLDTFKDKIPFLILECESFLGYLLNKILHNSKFQKLESGWKGLQYLVDSIDGSGCLLDILSVTKNELYDDLSNSSDLYESHFYDVVYSRAYGQFGAIPYVAIAADYEFSNQLEDISALRQLGKICVSSHLPLITGLSPNFFGLNSFSEIDQLSSIEELMKSKAYIKWRSFLSEKESEYIVIVLPRVLMRQPYKCTLSNSSIGQFTEDISNRNSELLCGSAVYAFSYCFVKSLTATGMCLDLLGHSGQIDNNAKSVDNMVDGYFPVESIFSEEKVNDLVRSGFNPISVFKANDKISFLSSNSVRWGKYNYSVSNPEELISAMLSSKLEYLFIALRVAQYLKVINRSMLGSSKSKIEVKSEMEQWLKRFVTDVENPSDSIRAKRPIKRINLIDSVSDENIDDSFSFTLTIVPHLKFKGEDMMLNVDLNVSLE